MPTALKLVSARQCPTVAYIDIVLANMTTGVDVNIIEVPQGAVIIEGNIVTTEAWNSTSTDVLDVGDAGSQNRYLNDGNIRALAALVALVPTGYAYTAPTKLTARWVSGGGSPTTGKARIRVMYYVQGRAEFAQGLDA